MAPYEPSVLRGQRIPFHEVFETFLLHAAVVYDTQGAPGLRAFLLEYGLDPRMESLQSLPWEFDELQLSKPSEDGDAEHAIARRLGEVLARISADLEANDPRGMEAVRELRRSLGAKIRPALGIGFVDGTPDFGLMDEAEVAFNEALEGRGPDTAPAEARDGGGAPIGTTHGEGEAAPATRVKLSFLESHDGAGLTLKDLGSPDVVEADWRSYALADGRTRVVGLFLNGEGPLGLVDVTFGPGHHVRDELEPREGGLRRYAESFVMDEGLAGKSHTSLGCFTAEGAAVLACVTCVGEPTKVSCPACFLAIVAAGVACNQPHCDQLDCNENCVQACHLYGLCSDTSGSSSPLDCQCYGLRNDTPGCGGDDCTEFFSIAVLREPGITVSEMNAREATVRQAITAKSGLGSTIAGWDAVPRLSWSQIGPDAIVAKTCEDDGGGGGGSGGGDPGGGGGGGTTCTHCSCTGEHTSWEGEVCGGSTEELVDSCWDSCW